jgi:internalin A
MRSKSCAFVALLGLSSLVVGCEGKPTETAVASASAKPAATPPPAVPEPEPEPERPKKTLADCSDDKEVSFPGAEFEGAVRVKLQKPDGVIKKAELKSLRSLNLSQVALDELDICLFHYMTGLKELFLGKGKITDLGPIVGATRLESLRASLNPIVDLSPLEKMVHMDRLDLAHTKVTDLSPLSGMTKLTELALNDTPIEDLSALSKMTAMETLSLQRTKVKDVSPLKDMSSLKFIYVADSPAADDPLAFTALRKHGAKVVLIDPR